MKLDGYKEAEKLGKEINALLEKHPIGKRNAREWMKFCRTISSNLQLLNEFAYLKAKTITQEIRKWTGTWPIDCQFCGTDLTLQEYFVDGKTLAGAWALMCPICWSVYGIGVGLGKGQKYDSKTLEKLKG